MGIIRVPWNKGLKKEEVRTKCNSCKKMGFVAKEPVQNQHVRNGQRITRFIQERWCKICAYKEEHETAYRTSALVEFAGRTDKVLSITRKCTSLAVYDHTEQPRS